MLFLEMTTHSSIAAWKIPWTEEPGSPQSIEMERVDTTEQLSMHLCIFLHVKVQKQQKYLQINQLKVV